MMPKVMITLDTLRNSMIQAALSANQLKTDSKTKSSIAAAIRIISILPNEFFRYFFIIINIIYYSLNLISL